MATKHQASYALRNDASETFSIIGEVSRAGKTGDEGAEITCTIHRGESEPFTYIVDFGGEFTKTKKNFTPEMYLHTALSVVCSQLESGVYQNTKLRVHRASGLMDTELL